ncbi:MAG TPA: DUF2071 domain-containing protein, partial [Verrucomicrobiae bacterium]|nr:DUF2071 domain-containing protein [Verrucomicrobiae bacterium]
MHPLLSQIAHRTAPMPSRPWIMVQKWHDLLFAHWPLPPDHIRPLVPRELVLDLRDGHAWVGVIPFWMSGIRARATPAIPRLSTTPELNVRTYVTYRGIPGVYFWSLDCASRLAVWGARTFYHLPYLNASMSVQNAGQSFSYRCTRLENPRTTQRSKASGDSPVGPAESVGDYRERPAEFVGDHHESRAEFRATSRPVGPARQREKTTLEHFLTERYCLYTVHRGKVLRAYIHHLPWPL